MQVQTQADVQQRTLSNAQDLFFLLYYINQSIFVFCARNEKETKSLKKSQEKRLTTTNKSSHVFKPHRSLFPAVNAQ